MIVQFSGPMREPSIGGQVGRHRVGDDAPGARPILVVDDDENIVEMIREALESDGHAVVTARDGSEAMDRIRSVRPAAVFLDMRMPVMDGWEFARAARAAGMSAPIVVITAAADARGWAGEISADGYLSKPFTIEQLLGMADRFRTGRPS